MMTINLPFFLGASPSAGAASLDISISQEKHCAENITQKQHVSHCFLSFLLRHEKT
jgi:hypothetical protein